MASPTPPFPGPPYDYQLFPFLMAMKNSAKEVSAGFSDSAGYVRSVRQYMVGFNQMMQDEVHIHKLGGNVKQTTIQGPRGKIPMLLVPAQCGDDPGFELETELEEDQRSPVILFVHGGALVSGNAYTGLPMVLDTAAQVGATVVSVQYGLAPENQLSEPAEDCYAAVCWVAANAGNLGVDQNRMFLHGASAGGGIAAAVALMLRDRNGPALCGLLLQCPMLDDRCITTSYRQFWEGSTGGQALTLAWSALLGDRVGNDGVNPYAAPGRATDLSQLPTTYLDVGDAEPFRDEVVSFASRLWQHGVATELHVWPGTFHGFDVSVPTAEVSKASILIRNDWVRRRLEAVKNLKK